MKKGFLFLGLVFLSVTAFSQELRFSKGDKVPGKLESGRAYEDFLSGRIVVTDNAGTTYTFVKADFSLLTRDGKKLQFEVNKVWFNEEQSKSIVLADDEGTIYTFSNVVVKDVNGKEFILPELKFEHPSRG